MLEPKNSRASHVDVGLRLEGHRVEVGCLLCSERRALTWWMLGDTWKSVVCHDT